VGITNVGLQVPGEPAIGFLLLQDEIHKLLHFVAVIMKIRGIVQYHAVYADIAGKVALCQIDRAVFLHALGEHPFGHLPACGGIPGDVEVF